MSGLDNIVNSHAIGISLMGLAIVFMALTTVSLFLWSLPKILSVLGPYLTGQDAVATAHSKRSKAEARQENLEVIAAIGFALQHHRRHD